MTNSPVVTEEYAHAINGVAGRMFARTVGGKNYKENTFTSQKWAASREYRDHGAKLRMRVKIRFDDECRNGHNTFSITCDIDEWRAGAWREFGGGAAHDEIAKVFPKLAPLIKWHLTSSDGPMHYIANTIYHASDRDYNGLLKGERRQIINGRTKQPAWRLMAIGPAGDEFALHEIEKNIDGEEKPDCPYTLEYRPWCRVGEGKARDFAAARNAAVWPDATDEQLSLPRDELKALLESRHGRLMSEFKSDVEACGFMWSPSATQINH
ncbi:hypothetical protein SAMN05428983_0868 [Agrobacterium fabrum]|uniref:Uncharacterized protein n=1 Tax=Agrobacterium fabrum TaxID=1176649 RepID=A0A7Z7FMK1_9HYPH|nr:hypothetical protein [Agrobacterium fabrum]SDJ26023.1 hypothetical protein SAMN05428983_0868 [Agrobacterium fabrum]